MSLISGLILAWQDKHAERVLKRKQPQPDEVAKLGDVKYFPITFWLVTFTIVFYYGAILPFVALGKWVNWLIIWNSDVILHIDFFFRVFFERKYDLDPERANLVNSILFIISVFLSPFLGLLVDKFGKNVSFVFLSVLITILGHVMLGFTFINPLICMVSIILLQTTSNKK